MFQVRVHLIMKLLHFQADFPLPVGFHISFDLYLFFDCCSPLNGKIFNALLKLSQL